MYRYKYKIRVLSKLYNKTTTFSFVNHLREDGHGRPQHIGGVPYITIFIIFYCGVVVDINIVNYFTEWKMDNTEYSVHNQLPMKY
jgi:hypothetical protein